MTQPTTSLRITWESLDSGLYEDMVSALLSILHPSSMRTDGSGGDGGRDVHFQTDAGLEIFELKSFTGRMVSSRRQQVKQSLVRALQLNPGSWHLVVPIDFTPDEQRWFEQLTLNTNVQCQWLGKTWLDARMAANRCVARYFLSDVNDEIRQLAVLFQQEQAALTNGVPDAANRLRVLKEQCDEIDPFYRVDLATDSASGSITARLSPRYPGATRDRPIRIDVALVVPDSAAGSAVRNAIQSAYDFGTGVNVPADFVTRVTVDAPVGLGGKWSSGSLLLSPAILHNVPELSVNLVVTRPDGTHLATLPLSGRAQTAGARGTVINLTDASGMFNLTLSLDMVALVFRFNYKFELQPCLPSVGLPVFRFLSTFCAPNNVTLQMPDGTRLGTPSPIDKREAHFTDGFVESIQQMARVQDTTNVWFNFPNSLSATELQEMSVAYQLLNGNIVNGTWVQFSGDMTTVHARAFLQNLTDLGGDTSAAISLWETSQRVIQIGDHQIPLGNITTRMHSARLLDPGETTRKVDKADLGDTIRFDFVPANANTLEQWRGNPNDRCT